MAAVSFQITIAPINGGSLILKLLTTDCLDKVCSIVELKMKVPLYRQSYFWGGLKVSDKVSLFKQGIHNGSVVYLVDTLETDISKYKHLNIENKDAKGALYAFSKDDLSADRAAAVMTIGVIDNFIRINDTAQRQARAFALWPEYSQVYCSYLRMNQNKELMRGLISCGLSNSYVNNFTHYPMGAGIELQFERRANEAADFSTKESLVGSWMFGIMQYLSHYCFSMGLQVIKTLVAKNYMTVEVPNIKLSDAYINEKNGHCYVLLAYSGEPEVTCGFTTHGIYVSFIHVYLLTVKEYELLKHTAANLVG